MWRRLGQRVGPAGLAAALSAPYMQSASCTPAATDAAADKSDAGDASALAADAAAWLQEEKQEEIEKQEEQEALILGMSPTQIEAASFRINKGMFLGIATGALLGCREAYLAAPAPVQRIGWMQALKYDTGLLAKRARFNATRYGLVMGIYSAADVGLEAARGGEADAWNKAGAGLISGGMLGASAGGLRGAIFVGGIGAFLLGGWWRCAMFAQDQLKEMQKNK